MSGSLRPQPEAQESIKMPYFSMMASHLTALGIAEIDDAALEPASFGYT